MTDRRKVGIALGALVLLGLGGLGLVQLVSAHTTSTGSGARPQATICADTYKVLNLRPSQVTAANAACLVQSLRLGGEVGGLVAQAFPVGASSTDPAPMCTTPKRWDGFPKARLAFVAAKKAYRLRIAAPGVSQHQTLTISNVAGIVELTSLADPTATWNQASGTVKINPDGVTGTIDVNVLRDVNGAKPVHITGQWACGAPLPLPTPDAAVPCSRFYAINHLQDSDIARMKAQACNAVDLTFSGDVTGHLDHAITDTAIRSGWVGIGDDNVCSSIRDSYRGSIKFSLGDETFGLTLRAQKYPTVSPGQYSFGTPGANAFLVLGHADPEHNGIFVEDNKIFWSASGGSITIGSDMKSGTIDESFSGLGNGLPSNVRVVGSWRCAA